MDEEPSGESWHVESDCTKFTSVTQQNVGCSEHSGKELELYCETCGELICLKCATKAGKHHDHDYADLNEAFKLCKREITKLLEPVENQLTTVNKALAQIDTCRGEVSDQEETIEADIQDSFKRLNEIMDARKTELISQLHQITQGKRKGLAAQRDQIEITKVQLSRCLEFMKESLRTSSQEEVLKGKANLIMQVKELNTAYQPDMLKPSTRADIIFSASTDVMAVFQKYGQVSAPDPSKWNSEELVTVVEETYTVSIQVDERQPWEETIKSIECELVSEITGTRTKFDVKRREKGQYEISYQPTIKGKHELHIKVDSQHIPGSPVSVVATGKSPVERFGTPILTINGVKTAEGIALNRKGEVVVTEWKGNCAHVFHCSGKKLLSFGTYGYGHGQFLNPRAVAMDDKGDILVADSSNHRIQKFTAEGQFLSAVGSKGSGPLQFINCNGIAFNRSNNKVYAVDKNDRVQILNSDLTFSSMFGKKGKDNGQFDNPSGITCDDTGNVYVAEQNNHRIQVFTPEGTFLRTFGTYGTGREQLYRPGSVAVDANGFVYVSEYENHRISVFTSMGQFVTSFGKWGSGPGEFKYPRGITVDGCGVVYVSDWGNNRVQLF